MRLLLAEDERALSKALTAILERNNYSVDAVYDGQSALDRSEERRVGKECTSWCISRWSPYH